MENRENVQELHKKHSDHLKINITGVRFYDTYKSGKTRRAA